MGLLRSSSGGCARGWLSGISQSNSLMHPARSSPTRAGTQASKRGRSREPIQQRIENPLATKLLNGEFGPGDTISRGLQGKEFCVREAGRG